MRNEWIIRRLESLFDNILFALIWALGATMVNIIKELPLSTIVGIGVGLFLFILLVLRLVLRRVTQSVYGIVPILRRMDARLRGLAKKYPEEFQIDISNIVDKNKDNQTELNIFGLNISETEMPEKAEDLPTTFQNILKKVQEVVDTKEQAKEDLEPMLLELSGIVDVMGTGLKKQRDGDSHYVGFKKQIDEYYDKRSNLIDAELNKLIQYHIFCSESFNNLLAQTKFLKQSGLISMFPANLKVVILGNMETYIDIILKRKRVKIGEYIQKLERQSKENGNKERK